MGDFLEGSGQAKTKRCMIIVSSIDHAEDAFSKFAPSHIVSILDRDEPLPRAFDTISTDHHLKIIENCSRTGECGPDASAVRCERLISFAKKWMEETGGASPILIHCHQGVARSTAAAYIILCAVEKDTSEDALATRLRDAAPHAEPNLLLVSEADSALDRHDRMIEAILDLCPCSATVAAPIVTLPVSA